MKKLICNLLAIIMVSASLPFAYAEQPSGLKDVNVSESVNPSAEINVKAKTGTSNKNLVKDNNIEYDIKLKAGTEKTSVFTITASCGNVSDVNEVVLGENGYYNNTYVLKDCPIGANTLNITVKADDAEVASYSSKMAVTPQVPRYYLDEVTQKLGFNTPYDHGLYRETMQVNGVRAMRTELGRWGGREKKKGTYDFSATTPYMNAVDKLDIEVLAMMGMNNSLYMDSGTGNGPDSKTNIDGYAKYVAAVAKEYPQSNFFEIWNEPNIAFWVNPNPIDYAYTCEVSYREAEKVNPDGLITIGSVAGGDSKFIANTLSQQIWGSIDAVSYHPYTRPSTVDDAMAPLIKSCHGTIVEAGGWKIPINSEIGWPSNNIGIGITPEQQAIELAKVHIVETGYGVPMTIIHNTFDTSWDKTASTEAHYGIVYPDWSPKPSFYSTREVNNQLNGSVHIGKIFFEDNKDIQMHLFARDNKIHAAIWTKGEDVTVDLGQNVAIYDMIGNYVGNSNNVTVTEEVQYIHGLNKDWFIRGLADTMEEIYNDAIGSLDDCKDSAGFDKANEIIYSTVKEAKSLNEIPSEEEALSLLRSHYAKASQIIEMYKNDELDIPFKRLTGLLYINQLMGNFNDIGNVEDYAAEAFQALYNYGIISGDDKGMLNPDGNITRAEAAKILCGIIYR